MTVRPPAGSVRLPWLVGLVLLLVFGLGLALQAAPSTGVSTATLTDQRDLVADLADAAGADLGALQARLAAAAETLPAEPAQADVDRVRLMTGATGVELAPSAGPGLRSGETVPQPTSAVRPPSVYAVGGVLAAIVDLDGGSTLRAAAPADGLLPAAAVLVTPTGTPVLDAGAPATTAGGLSVLAGAGPAVQLEGSTVVAAAPLPDGEGLPDWSVLLTRTLEVQGTEALPLLLPGVLLLVLSAFVFTWLYRTLVAPVLRLAAAGQRFADGDLDTAIPIGRLDEVGVVAQGLERARVLLVRREVRAERGHDR